MLVRCWRSEKIMFRYEAYTRTGEKVSGFLEVDSAEAAEEALVITEPDASFAESMIQALQKPEEMRTRARRARRLIEEKFSWSAITEQLTAVYEGK